MRESDAITAWSNVCFVHKSSQIHNEYLPSFPPSLLLLAASLI